MKRIFYGLLFVMDAQRWRGNFLALAACKSVSDAPTALLATGVGGERTRRVGFWERMDA